MRIESLLSPGILSNGIRLRTEASRAISSAEIAAARAGGVSSSATVLAAFFTDCASKLAALRDVTAPTAVGAAAPAADAKTITVTFSEGLNDKIVPATSAFVFSPAKTVSSVVVRGTQVILTTTAAVANGNTVTYTPPAVNLLQDPGGNTVVATGAVSIVVA